MLLELLNFGDCTLIRKQCDNCDKPLEFDDTQAGKKVPCPHCGDMNLVPLIDRPSAAGLPPDAGPEKEVLVVRPSMMRAHPFLTFFTLGLGILPLWFKNLGERIHVTNKRTVMRTGLFSKRTTEVLHDHVRNIQVSQTFVNRVFSVGTLAISSSGQDGIEIVASDIPHPEKIKRTIDLYRPL
jgi:Bacterial PH domain